MILASVVSPIIGDGLSLATGYRPRLVDIPGASLLTDVTGANPPILPNEMVCEAIFTDAAFALVEADAEYLVNWSEAI